MILRVNMCAQVANGIISPSMLNAEVHPKLDAKGQYPKGFQRPLKLRDFMAMDSLFLYFVTMAAPYPSQYLNLFHSFSNPSIKALTIITPSSYSKT